MIGDSQVDSTPNAITRHFPQPNYSASAAFLSKVAVQADQHDREVFAFVDASGVTVRLGNAPAPAATPGVTETDLELAVALTAIR